MDVIFYLVPSLMLAGVLAMAAAVVRRSRRISTAWNSGFTAEGRCLRSYTTTSSEAGEHHHTRTTLHHVYEFTAADGRPVRFEEKNGPGTVIEGDYVTVHYTPEHPEQATALPPMRGRLMAESGVLLVFLGVFAALCVAFMIGVHTFFDLADGVFGSDSGDLPADFPTDFPTP
ncbi:DUF3592 domain-containing protein [Streptomyces acidiscabies]|uniref:DUF3592 domain-containing protein n=1 Tax=Streptomyces acidiscabies TaxID=42234 RepID=A0AAP6B7D7_9ACTN|nr:DUF3592 domain-containing protein [Streptomyces acidiscabies]MBP5939407.1 DUF3592 domain-containing protein [Streptomyces sp. LBUM 1476]MBZ3910548.1 DUF3592 domain-containing protein [Streptomyces acidiscabies]MDX2959548.1 DUF3592 domain-containing protein [Streptomyces acidiscabies]MDX3019164.1 DUF3592 domain-containing protein [Streptomyces acidiscabies]MDX3790755.1 DUF3592 domain-containing protein [Streptomyces acidiscabies]